MAIIAISRGSYGRGKEVAEKVARKLGYTCISREVILEASKEFNIPEIKLIHAFGDAPSILDRFTHGKERYIAYVRAALLRHLEKGDMVYHGFSCHFFAKEIPRVLRVRVISNLEDRIKLLMARDRVSRKEALKLLKRIDDQRIKWGKRLYGIDIWDPNLYDLVLRIDRITVEDAADTICGLAGLEPFRTTPESQRMVNDMVLAAEVKIALIDVKPNLEVSAEEGIVYIKTEAPLGKDSDLLQRVGEVAQEVKGLKGIKLISEKSFPEKRPGRPEHKGKSTRDVASTFFSEL